MVEDAVGVERAQQVLGLLGLYLQLHKIAVARNALHGEGADVDEEPKVFLPLEICFPEQAIDLGKLVIDLLQLVVGDMELRVLMLQKLLAQMQLGVAATGEQEQEKGSRCQQPGKDHDAPQEEALLLQVPSRTDKYNRYGKSRGAGEVACVGRRRQTPVAVSALTAAAPLWQQSAAGQRCNCQDKPN